MSFSPQGTLPPYEMNSENGRISVQGKIDRVDGWEDDGKLFLRIVDYKTGSTSFRLSDIVYGRNMQMLIYLFALKKYGPSFFGKPVVPAGILYDSSGDDYIDASPDISDEQRLKKLLAGRKHSGLVIADAGVCRAMDTNDPPVYLPVTFRQDGSLDGQSTFNTRQEALLNRYVDRCIEDCCRGILSGNIRALRREPQGKGACQRCEFRAICSPDRQPLEIQPVLNDADSWKLIEGGDAG
jgi:ATP-dependent helicase/nuclease subunit B